MPKALTNESKEKRKTKGAARDTLKEKRKTYAKKCLLEAISSGTRLKTRKDVARFLEDYVEEHSLPEDFFGCLDTQDLCELSDSCIDAINAKSENGRNTPTNSKAPTINTNIKQDQSKTTIKHGLSTPNSSARGSECDDLGAELCNQDDQGETQEVDNSIVIQEEDVCTAPILIYPRTHSLVGRRFRYGVLSLI
jgi:hypothetical protein